MLHSPGEGFQLLLGHVHLLAFEEGVVYLVRVLFDRGFGLAFDLDAVEVFGSVGVHVCLNYYDSLFNIYSYWLQ